MKNDLAPVVLFTYKRLWHTKETLNALQNNTLANKSNLFVYSDGYKNENDKDDVLKVREYLKTVSGFRSFSVIEKEKNYGLADSIVSGVTEIVNKYGKVIVIEDDIVTSKYFLEYMNNALDFYENKDKVWHIGGYVPNIDIDIEEEVFFNRTMYCWGWATWRNRWKYFSRDIGEIDTFLDRKKIYELNLEGTNKDVYAQFLANKNGNIKTWAVFWYINIYMHKGLCLIPTKSLVHNIGNDNTGTNCTNTKIYDTGVYNYAIETRANVIENQIALDKLKKFYKG